ncbi:MAG TPA: hypothetical protein VK203_11915 [Nostocaceae cyanobacterium]|nr:hypothetical protein [Nostocaceae cyanobacterium]
MTLSNIQPQQDEFYHIFVPYQTALEGGIQKVTLRSGKSYDVKISASINEGDKVRLESHGLYGNDVVLILHSLFDKYLNIEKSIDYLITTSELKPESKTACRKVYQHLKDGKYPEYIAANELLDFIVDHFVVEPSVNQRYRIASQNSKLSKIEEIIEKALEASHLKEIDKQSIRGTLQFIKAGEGIDSFDVLNQLDSIIENSLLPHQLKQLYFNSSVQSRAITADLYIIDLINNSSKIPAGISRSRLLKAYCELRDGKKVSDETVLRFLDSLILESNIPDDCKVIYKLMREPVTNQQGNSQGNDDIINKVKKVSDSVKKASKIVPIANKVASTIGMKAGTGVAIGTLSGGAATNATLALLGGGSVAAGGLGMLGGLAVATGGAALIGAAALVSIVSVTQMDNEDKKNLGIAAGIGVAGSAAAVGTAWAAVGAFGVASTGTAISTLSGAAAYSAIMAALGGVGAITGGAAVVAAGVGFAAWKFLQGNKNDPKRILKQLEAKLYS